MGAFLTGLTSGYTKGVLGKKKEDRKGLLRRKKKTPGGQPGGTPLPADLPSYKRGGRVKRTGRALVHKGERVLTRKQAKRYRAKR